MKRPFFIIFFAVLVAISAIFLVWFLLYSTKKNNRGIVTDRLVAQDLNNPALKTIPADGVKPVLKVRIIRDLGPHLVTTTGITLYYSTKDRPGVSNCTGACAQNWLPYIVPADIKLKGDDGVTGTIGTIQKSNGALQLTYNGAPLYTWHGDSEADDISGQGVNGTWFMQKP